MKTFDEETGILTINEFDLHDLIIALPYVFDKSGIVQRVKIVPTEPDKFDEHLATRWEGRMNRLLDGMYDLDGMFHDDAEYTC